MSGGWGSELLNSWFVSIRYECMIILDVILINASINSRKAESGEGGGASFLGKPLVGAAHAASGVTGVRCLC